MQNNFDSQKFKFLDAESYSSLTRQFDYFTERFAGSFAERMIELAEISPADQVLDVGTGTGVVALRAACHLNGSGKVFGVDLSGEMLERAKTKAALANLEDKISFIEMDAEKLCFGNEKFDVVVSLFALLHFPNPQIALQEIFRVLRPGGRIVIAVGSGAPIFSLTGSIHILKKLPDILANLQGKLLIAPNFLNDFVSKHIPPSLEPEESHLATLHGSRIQNVRAVIKKAGFEVIKQVWQGDRRIIETPEEFWEIQRTFSSIARKRLSLVTAEKFQQLHDSFVKICESVQDRGGQLIYPLGASFVVGKKAQAQNFEK